MKEVILSTNGFISFLIFFKPNTKVVKNSKNDDLIIFFLSLHRIKILTMNITGLIIGLVTFLVIGLFHPLVIKAEYYLGVKSWWIFLLLGIAFMVASVLVADLIISIVLGVVAFSSFWSILEIFQQHKRVEKGWFPAGPGHSR